MTIDDVFSVCMPTVKMFDEHVKENTVVQEDPNGDDDDAFDGMELGNLLFGNSRGNFHFQPSDAMIAIWTDFTQNKLQVSDTYCHIDRADVYDKERTCKIPATEYGGCVCKDESGDIVFEIFPYYWGDEEDLLKKHNFVFHPGKTDEFSIDWYKYPFRDSYCNREVDDTEFGNIINQCIQSMP